METNKKKTVQVLFVGFLVLLFSAGTVFGQGFNNVESLIKSRVKRGFGNLCISDTSPEADELVKTLTHNKFREDRVLVRYFFESEQPVSSAQYSFINRDVTLELANVLTGFVEEEYYRQLSSLDPKTITEVKKSIGIVVTQAIVKDRGTELEISWSAEHPDGRELYGIYGFYSAPKPGVDIERILAQTNSANKRDPSGIAQRPAAMSESEIISIVKNVDEILINDTRLKKILERMDSLREE
jgi:hypothetical protein